MKRSLLLLLAIALIIAGLLSWFASSQPDGLERVAEDIGFSSSAKDPSLTVMPDYSVPGVHGFWSNALAGIIGTLAVFAMVYGIGRLSQRRKR